MPSSNDQIRIDVILNTQAAVEQLQAMTTSAKSVERVVTSFGDYLLTKSKQWGVPLKELRRDFEALDAELRAREGKSLFPAKDTAGNAIPSSEIFTGADDYLRAKEAANGFRMSNEGVVTSINHVTGAMQGLNNQVNLLQKPARNNLGQFLGGKDFEKGLGTLTVYGDKVKYVQDTIERIATKTGASFKQIGAGMEKAFPSLQNTNLVGAAIENLNNKVLGLNKTFKSTKQLATEVQQSIAKIQQSGGLNLAGSPRSNIQQVAAAIRQISAETGSTFEEAAAGLRKMGVNGAVTRGALQNVNKELQGFRHGIDVVRTALGTLTAIGIFTFINAITQAFSEASKAARELEDSLFRLGNVEKILSEGGADVSMEGLKKGIVDIKKLFPIFSKEDITQLVAQISISTKELGFSEKQILDLAKAVGVLNVRSTEEETASQTAQKVISSLITDNAKGIAGLGLSFNETTMEAEAMKMGLLDAGRTMNDLTNEEKAQVKYQILLENTNGELDSMGDYLDTNTAKLKENSAAWHDMLTTWGALFNTLKPGLTWLYTQLDHAGTALKIIIVAMAQAQTRVTMFFEAMTKSGPEALAILKKIPDEVDKVGKSMAKRLFPEGNPFGTSNSQWFNDLFKGMDKEHATNPYAGAAEEAQKEGQKLKEATVKVEEDIQKIMQEGRDKRQDIDEAYRRKIEDANQDHAQKLADIARDVERKQADALLNLNQKLEDIDRDANQKIAEAKQDDREKDLDREREYQNKLRELREKFLFDLEDALRERDARQVLRLIREYQRDKKNLEEKRKLDNQESKKDLAQKLADIERERQIKIEAANREYQQKLADIAIWQARERADAALALQRKLADARLWHQRELAEYQQYLQRKLQELAKSIVKEYQLTAAGAAAIYKLLNSYYGSSGSISNLLATGLSNSLNGIVSGATGGSSTPIVSPTWSQGGFYGAAEGGTFVATRPTKVVFGERGPEVASFTPLGRTGSDVGKMFGNTSTSANSTQGYINLRISLQDGLVSDIIETSLENISAEIDRIGRQR